MYFRNVLSEHHLREDVRDVIKLSTGLIGTMAPLVLGLLIASAKSWYNAMSNEIKQITANVILLDLKFERYGPDAQNLRIVLRKAIAPLIDQIWSEGDRVKFSPLWRPSKQQNLSTNFGNSSRTTIHSVPLKRNC